MKRKYATTLEKNISNFVRRFGIQRAINGDEFAYYHNLEDNENFITFTIFWSSANEIVANFIDEKYDTNIQPWLFVFSLLHEVGHHMTKNLLTDEDLETEAHLRPLAIIEGAPPELYLSLPSEDLADRWALEYIYTHQIECWKFQRKCGNIINHIWNKKSFQKTL